MNEKYTDRQVAIFTDVHGLIEPLVAVIEDIGKRGISEIYSLGDNIGVGPSPSNVIDMLEYYNVNSVSGNAEEYCNLGIAPYKFYFDGDKLKNYMWTRYKLGEWRLDYINSLPHSYDLELGGKRIALCHFANDIRIDYGLNDVRKYLYYFDSGEAYKQFLYTNSQQQIETINYNIERFGINNPAMRGYVSAREYPIFGGKTVDRYDAIIQGHIHRTLYEKGDCTEFYSYRAMAVHFDDDPIDMAFYIILHEKKDNLGFDIEKVYVPFDRERMEDTILRSDEPTGKIKKYVRMK